MPSKSSLTDKQIREILRLRLSGKSRKEIARAVKCSVDHVVYHYRKAGIRVGERGGKGIHAAKKKYRAKQAKMARAAGLAKQRERERIEAAEELRKQISLAREETATAPLFRSGDTGGGSRRRVGFSRTSKIGEVS